MCSLPERSAVRHGAYACYRHMMACAFHSSWLTTLTLDAPPPPPPPATQWQACPEARPQIERTVEMSLQLRVGGCGVAASEVTPGALP